MLQKQIKQRFEEIEAKLKLMPQIESVNTDLGNKRILEIEKKFNSIELRIHYLEKEVNKLLKRVKEPNLKPVDTDSTKE